MMLRSSLIASMSALLLAGSGTAQARAPATTIKFLPDNASDLVWRGRGDVTARHRFCVESSTRQFELIVSSTTGGLNGQAVIPYEVTVELNGRTETGIISKSTPTFSVKGLQSRGGTCRGRDNVGLLTVRLLQQDALSAVTGRYADQLNVSVSPN